MGPDLAPIFGVAEGIKPMKLQSLWYNESNFIWLLFSLISFTTNIELCCNICGDIICGEMIHFNTKSVNYSSNVYLIHPPPPLQQSMIILSSYLCPIKSDRGWNDNEEGPLVSIVTGQTYCLYCFTKTHVICQQNATILVYSKTTRLKVIFLC